MIYLLLCTACHINVPKILKWTVVTIQLDISVNSDYSFIGPLLFTVQGIPLMVPRSPEIEPISGTINEAPTCMILIRFISILVKVVLYPVFSFLYAVLERPFVAFHHNPAIFNDEQS